ncbi:hypothetical protein [Bacteroides sp.]|uniref:hypothetical protein n=1 Tax=Bacteroides sp. TaxID=29523 RepID=UPI0026080218|nr:hypothetical protein [Bacteroides sp.]MDD3039600.1 hypothetical protein [Bacteroides sp.]
MISTINVCNFGSDLAVVRIAHVTDGSIAELADTDWVVYDMMVAPNGILPLTIGMTLDQGDSLVIYSDIASTTFIAWGAEE